MTEDQQAVLDLLALAHNIEPMIWRVGETYLDSDFNVVEAPIWDWSTERGPPGECPLTHAARVLVGESFQCFAYDRAAEALGIPLVLALDIVRAADSPLSHTRDSVLACYNLSEAAA